MARHEEEYEYNPVKEQVGGKEAERVIWSSSVINKALEAITKGLPLKSNPFIGKNTKLLKPDLVFKRTEEEIEDYIKCMKDPVYFASKCYLMTPEGLKPCILRDYQIDYLRHLQKNRFSIFLSCRQSGKCFSLFSTVKLLIKNSSQFANKLKKIDCFYIKDNIYELPIFELFNIYDNSFIWKLKYPIYKLIYNLTYGIKTYKITQHIINFLYKILSIIDYIDYHYIKNEILIDNYKTINEIDISNDSIKILTDTGFKPLSHLLTTKPFEIYTIELENGYKLDCADEHIVFNENMEEIYVQDLKVNDYIQTDEGLKRVISITYNPTQICMCDVSVNDDNHRFYSNGILSHNSTTTAIYCLWVILFSVDKNGLILSKSGPAGQDLLSKIKDMYLYLPYHLKIGTLKWNQSSISFDNNSSISTEAFSPTAGLGKTINFLILDEFAWCPPNEVELFYNNIIPTVTTISDSNVCIMSTQNGFNLFYKIWKGAIEKKNIYAPFKVDWNQVPQFNTKTKQWEKRTEKWKEEMIGVLGSKEAFYYQYGTQFSASDKCLVTRECLAKLRDKAILYVNKEELDIYLNYKNNLFWDPDFDLATLNTGWFVILVDLAEGGGKDSTVFNILQYIGNEKLKQVGVWRSNEVELERAALDFWLLTAQLFNHEKCLISIEWNTYGALFYNMISNLNEQDYDRESLYRFNMLKNYNDEIDLSIIVHYKKGNTDDQILGKVKHTSNFIPGIKFTPGNKGVSCALLKMDLEKELVLINDLVIIGELENFEDKNGSGTYKASYGHDDNIMTLVQIPQLKQTSKWKDWIEEYEIENLQNNMDNKWMTSNETFNPFEIQEITYSSDMMQVY